MTTVEEEYIDKLMSKYGSINYKCPDKEKVEFARALISCAETDSKASRSLYETGLYSLAVFHLQQSVEKLAKSYLLTYGVVEIEDLRKDIGHDSLLVFTKIAEIFNDFIPIIKSTNPEINTNYQALNGLVDDVKSKLIRGPSPHELMLITFEQIEAMFHSYDTMSTKLISAVQPLMNLLLGCTIECADENARNQLDNSIGQAISDMGNIFSLYILTAITFPHEQCTRYPGMNVTPTEYTESIGIVKATPLLLERIESVQSSLRRYLDLFPVKSIN